MKLERHQMSSGGRRRGRSAELAGSRFKSAQAKQARPRRLPRCRENRARRHWTGWTARYPQRVIGYLWSPWWPKARPPDATWRLASSCARTLTMSLVGMGLVPSAIAR